MTTVTKLATHQSHAAQPDNTKRTVELDATIFDAFEKMARDLGYRGENALPAFIEQSVRGGWLPIGPEMLPKKRRDEVNDLQLCFHRAANDKTKRIIKLTREAEERKQHEYSIAHTNGQSSTLDMLVANDLLTMRQRTFARSILNI